MSLSNTNDNTENKDNKETKGLNDESNKSTENFENSLSNNYFYKLFDTIKTANKEYSIENFVDDEELINDYKKLNDGLKERFKYTLIWDTLVIYGSMTYIKNIEYYMDRYFPKRNNTFGSLLKVSLIHSLSFFTIFVCGNLLILQLNPFSYVREYKRINKRILEINKQEDFKMDDLWNLVNSKDNKIIDEIIKETKSIKEKSNNKALDNKTTILSNTKDVDKKH